MQGEQPGKPCDAAAGCLAPEAHLPRLVRRPAATIAAVHACVRLRRRFSFAAGGCGVQKAWLQGLGDLKTSKSAGPEYAEMPLAQRASRAAGGGHEERSLAFPDVPMQLLDHVGEETVHPQAGGMQRLAGSEL